MSRRDAPTQRSEESWLALQPNSMAKRGLLGARVAQLIERLIIEQGLKYGDRLPSGRELTERFAVSRTVVRDAISMLEQRGLLETRPGSGVYVTDGSSGAVSDVLGQMLRQDAISFPELMEARQLLEVHGAAAAARCSTEDDLAEMAATIAQMKSARGSMSFVEADVAFHEALGKSAGNRVLAAFLKSLRPLLVQGMLVGTTLEGARETAIREHTAILDAISDRDEQLVRQLMADHLQRSYEEWRRAGQAAPMRG
jgi:GntR family transcriptional repressor for pyruvate dehydrogenase complex